MALITPVIGVSLALPGCSALLLCARGPATWPGGFAFLSRGSSHVCRMHRRKLWRTAPAPIGTVLRLRPDKPGAHAAHQITAKINSLHAASRQDCLREKLCE
ncbi:hypothetical protein B0H17DRAFT_1153892 [Mycena rosella]|uniref:Secreted protein n=1 Tax=Mycena rosella TaxID=1033263 RepID=A0AAD7B2F3_MYCRO|nr:hypothetical protein B0H17DRAFT_1153892 [Mycena rosella]